MSVQQQSVGVNANMSSPAGAVELRPGYELEVAEQGHVPAGASDFDAALLAWQTDPATRDEYAAWERAQGSMVMAAVAWAMPVGSGR